MCDLFHVSIYIQSSEILNVHQVRGRSRRYHMHDTQHTADGVTEIFYESKKGFHEGLEET